jgi:hypothetical protein
VIFRKMPRRKGESDLDSAGARLMGYGERSNVCCNLSWRLPYRQLMIHLFAFRKQRSGSGASGGNSGGAAIQPQTKQNPPPVSASAGELA